MFIDFRERKEERDVREKHQPIRVMYVPQPEIKLTTNLCALTRNQTCNLLVYRLMLQTTEQSGQGGLSNFVHSHPSPLLTHTLNQ